MPISHSIDNGRQLSVTTITGRITITDAIDYIKDRTAEDSGEHLPVLVDARDAERQEFLITDMDLLARLAGEIHQHNGTRKEAFVALDEHNVGLMTIFRKFSTNSENQRVFEDLDDAIGWLKADEATG